jgi:hypothetical protein
MGRSNAAPLYAGFRLARAAAAVVELVLGHFPAEGVAVNAEDFGGAGLISVGAFQDTFDKAFFKFAHGLVKENAPFDHLHDQTFQLISHVRTLRYLYFVMGR